MDIDELIGETKPLDIPFPNGKVLHVEYRPNGLTLQEIVTAQGSKPEDLAPLLSNLVASWDLVRKGVAVPTTTESLVTLPANVLADVLEAVMNDLNPPTTTAR